MQFVTWKASETTAFEEQNKPNQVSTLQRTPIGSEPSLLILQEDVETSIATQSVNIMSTINFKLCITKYLLKWQFPTCRPTSFDHKYSTTCQAALWRPHTLR
jgi:hypothetical protein